MMKFLSPRNSSKEPSRKWKLNILGARSSIYLNQTQEKISKSSVHICSRRKLLEVYLERARHLVKKDHLILPL